MNEEEFLRKLQESIVDAINTGMRDVGEGGKRKYTNSYGTSRLNDIQSEREAIKDNNSLYARIQRRKLNKEEKVLKENQKAGFDKAGAKGAAGAAISKVGSAVSAAVDKYGSAMIALDKARQMAALNIARAGFTKQADTLKTQLGNLNVQINKSLSSGLGILTKTANEAAYDSGRAVQEIAKSNIKTRLDIINIEKKAELEIAQAKLDKFKAEREFQNQIIGGIGGAAQSIGSMLGPVGSAIGAAINIAGSVAQLSNKKEIMKKEMEIEFKKLENEQYQRATEIVNQQVEMMGSMVEPYRDFVKSVDDFAGKFDTATHKFAATIGYNGSKGREFAEYYRTAAVAVAKTFGASAEEIQKLQETYMSASNRAVNLSIKDMLGSMSVSRLFGMSPTESGQLFGEMNIFNTSISDGTDMMGHMYKTITKMGLSTNKFGKDLVNNLKLAQKYNFKGGVDNMMKMTKWAQQTRFNLNNATSFAEKLTTGSLSEVLESSAKLQVLGGSAGMYSDPLAMMYEAGADVGSLAKRQAAMFNDITGTFNKETGETEFNWYENRMLSARAQAMGMSVEDAKNMIRQSNKQGVIDKQLKGSGLSDEDRLAIGNRATYNKKNGRWEVVDIKGKTHDIEEYKNGKANINDLLPADTQESVLKVAQQSLGVEEQMKNLQAEILATVSGEQFGDFEKNTRERMQIQRSTYLENKENLNKISSKIREFDTNAMKKISENLNQLVGSGTAALDGYFQMALDNAGLDKERMDGLTEVITEVNENLEKYLKKLVTNMSGEMTDEQYDTMMANGGVGTPQIEYKDSETKGRHDKQIIGSNGLAMNFEQTQKYLSSHGIKIEDQGDLSRYDYFKGVDGNKYRVMVARTDKLENDPEKRYDAALSNGVEILDDKGKWQTQSPFYDDYGKLDFTYNTINKYIKDNGLQRIADGRISQSGVAQNIVIKNGKVTGLDANDDVLAGSNGSIAAIVNEILPGLRILVENSKRNSSGNVGELKITFGGSVRVEQDGSITNINLNDIANANPSQTTQFVQSVLSIYEASKSGKHA